MNQLYHIDNLCPRTDITLGRCGFCIKLWPAFKEAVAASGITQKQADHAVGVAGRAWLDGCGYDVIFDPDADPRDVWEFKHLGRKKPPSATARPLYQPNLDLRVQWGDWGPEHITVPGNACGLDIDQGIGAPIGGRQLTPHNVDSICQAHLLLVVFTFFAGQFVLDNEIKEHQAA